MYPFFPYVTSNITHPIHLQNSLFENVITVSSPLTYYNYFYHQPLHPFLTTNQLDASNMDTHIGPIDPQTPPPPFQMCNFQQKFLLYQLLLIFHVVLPPQFIIITPVLVLLLFNWFFISTIYHPTYLNTPLPQGLGISLSSPLMYYILWYLLIKTICIYIYIYI